MGPFQIVTSIRKEFEAKVEECMTIAEKTDLEECTNWDIYLTRLSLVPSSKEERTRSYHLQPSTVKGALPVEVRSVLLVHTQWLRHKINEYKHRFGTEMWWIDRVEKPLLELSDQMSKDAIEKYIGQITPSDIFKHADGMSTGYFDSTTRATAHSHQCPTCGAARPANTNYQTCHFCGADLF